jgi:hypothetical protein
VARSYAELHLADDVSTVLLFIWVVDVEEEKKGALRRIREREGGEARGRAACKRKNMRS